MFSISTPQDDGIPFLLGAVFMSLFKRRRCLLVVVLKGAINLLPLSHTLIVRGRFMILDKSTPTLTMIVYVSGQLEQLQEQSNFKGPN